MIQYILLRVFAFRDNSLYEVETLVVYQLKLMQNYQKIVK